MTTTATCTKFVPKLGDLDACTCGASRRGHLAICLLCRQPYNAEFATMLAGECRRCSDADSAARAFILTYAEVESGATPDPLAALRALRALRVHAEKLTELYLLQAGNSGAAASAIAEAAGITSNKVRKDQGR